MVQARTVKKWLLVAALLLATYVAGIATGGGESSHAQSYSRAKYMYKVVRVEYDEQQIQMVIDLFARDGWELVTHYQEIIVFKK